MVEKHLAIGVLATALLAVGVTAGDKIPLVEPSTQPATQPATAPGLATQPVLAPDTGAADAATEYIKQSALPRAVAGAMQTVFRQHPRETRWSGVAGNKLFAVVARKLPSGTMRQTSAPMLLELSHAEAVNELLTAHTLLQNYADAGLTDSTTLRQAVVALSGELAVHGTVQGMEDAASSQGDYAVAWVVADPAGLQARLQDPAAVDLVKRSYRDVMHAQALELMDRHDWSDALLLWRHLHRRKLVSQSLYVDAATCFHKSGQDDDAIRLLAEAMNTFASNATINFLQRVGDLAIDIHNPKAQALAERAYNEASRQLMNEVTTSATQPSEPLPRNVNSN